MTCCKICGSSDYSIHTAKERHFKIGDIFIYLECLDCKCLQIASFPEDMRRYYPDSYYSLRKGKEYKSILSKFRLVPYYFSLFRRNLIEQGLHKLFGSTRFDLLYETGISKSSRILDVGCGNGYKYLYALKEFGFANTMGCDPFINEPITYANGLRIEKSDILHIGGTWDLIMYHHSFEHVPNPHENLSRVSQLLSPNGICLIRIPTVSSFAWDKYKTCWYQLDAPRHFYLHSIESMRYLAEQHGMLLKEIMFDSNHKQFTNSDKYVQGESMIDDQQRGLLRFIKRKVKRFANQRKATGLNKAGRGDQAAFILQKI